MKRIFKPAAVFLTALLNFNVLADEGEIYKAELKNREPQVLIILDTSAHMKKKSDYPYPKVYDPNITYPPVSSTIGQQLVHNLFGTEYTYYNDASEAVATNQNELLSIAESQLLKYDSGIPFELDERYIDFLEYIPRLDSKKKFNTEEMNCYSALADLDGELGAYQDFVRQWLRVGGAFDVTFQWIDIASSGKYDYGKANHVDCQKDIDNSEERNPGYEHSGLGDHSDLSDGVEDGYSADTDKQGFPRLGEKAKWKNAYSGTKSNLSSSEEPGRYKTYLYSDNLVKWREIGVTESTTTPHVNENNNFKLSNLQIAKKVVLDLMLKTEGIKIGLEVFNSNETRFEWMDIANNHGGRILSGIQNHSDNPDKARALRKKVGQILTTSFSKSALCESLYEGYLYLYGLDIQYGNKFSLLSLPKRDKSVEDNTHKKYLNPLMKWSETCQTEAYVIIISAGYHDVSQSAFDWFPCEGAVDDHDHDNHANENIEALKGVDTSKAVQVNNANCDDNYLPVLSDWLARNDINKVTTDVKERIVTYTVGIGDLPEGNRNLLEKTAEYGDGRFYNALNANQLRLKLQMAFADILARQKGLASSVSTSINSENSTQSSEDVYYSMFEPNSTSRWLGNLRKLKVVKNSGVLSAWTSSASAAPAVSSAVAPVISNSQTAFFSDTLYSGWSSEQGLNDVKKGGVVESLKKRNINKNPRTIYINNADDTALLELTKDNLMVALGVSDDEELAAKLDIETENITSSINWLKGLNDTADAYRPDIFGDPMHSAPLVVPFSDGNRIFISTNAGFFHAFKDNGRAVEEEWAFIPREMLVNALALRKVTLAEERIYGIDGSAVDAEYSEGKTTKHIITFGLRRGGKSYYSFRVDEGAADQPALNWVIRKTDGGDFDELGQTWSTPVVANVFRGEGTSANPALIFGGGYDTGKDTCGVNGPKPCNDDEGRAIYIVDAVTGSLIKSFTNTIGCGEHCLNDSIAGQVVVMDSNEDGYTDRIYVADTGGNLYRVDIPVSYDVVSNKFSTYKENWRLVKRAKLGGTDAEDDRRFFTTPSIVRARELDGDSYDALLLGSGDVTKPNTNTTTSNYFFNIKDTNIQPVVWGNKSGEIERSIPAEIKNLTEISYDSTNKLDSREYIAKGNNLNGWKYELTEGNVTVAGKTSYGGEKSLGEAVVIKGTVHFNTYTPFVTEQNLINGQCVVNQSGNSHYYQVDLNTGGTKFYRKLPNTIAKDLAVHAASDDGASVLRLLGAGKGDYDAKNKEYKGTVNTAVTLAPEPIYLYFDEQKLANSNTSTRTDSDEAKQ